MNGMGSWTWIDRMYVDAEMVGLSRSSCNTSFACKFDELRTRNDAFVIPVSRNVIFMRAFINVTEVHRHCKKSGEL